MSSLTLNDLSKREVAFLFDFKMLESKQQDELIKLVKQLSEKEEQEKKKEKNSSHS